MSRSPVRKMFLAAVIAALALPTQPLLACAACYGNSDSPLAKAMNWGIFSLLVIVVCVLSGVGAFGIYLAKKSASVAAASAADQPAETTHKV